MRKLLSYLFLLIAVNVQAQTYPVPQGLGSPVTQVQNKGGFAISSTLAGINDYGNTPLLQIGDWANAPASTRKIGVGYGSNISALTSGQGFYSFYINNINTSSTTPGFIVGIHSEVGSTTSTAALEGLAGVAAVKNSSSSATVPNLRAAYFGAVTSGAGTKTLTDVYGAWMPFQFTGGAATATNVYGVRVDLNSSNSGVGNLTALTATNFYQFYASAPANGTISGTSAAFYNENMGLTSYSFWSRGGLIRAENLQPSALSTDSVVVKDSDGVFKTRAQSDIAGPTPTLQTVTDAGNTTTNDITLTDADLHLSYTTSASAEGVIYKGSNRWIHDFTPTGHSGLTKKNLFIGENAGNFTMTSSGSTSSNIIAIGNGAASSNTTGFDYTALGVSNLGALTEGGDHASVGNYALQSCTVCTGFSVLGYNGFGDNVSGADGSGVGYDVLANSLGSRNSGFGESAGRGLINGNNFLFLGNESGSGITGGHNTVVIGRPNISGSVSDHILLATGGPVGGGDGVGQERLRINASGAWSFNSGSSYGTSGQVFKSNGNAAVPEWADISTIITASNGLTLTGSDIELGGTLEENTLISMETFTMTFNNELDVPLFIISSPNQNTVINSGIVLKRNPFSTNTTLTSENFYAAIDAALGAVTVTLPDAADEGGAIYMVKKLDNTANAVTVVGTGGDLIDGAADYELTNENDAVWVISDETEWEIIGKVFGTGGGGAGTVTSFAFTDGSGFDGTVTNSTTTPTLALTTTITNTQVMFSNSGALTGDANFTYATATDRLTLTGNVDGSVNGVLYIAGTGTGTTGTGLMIDGTNEASGEKFAIFVSGSTATPGAGTLAILDPSYGYNLWIKPNGEWIFDADNDKGDYRFQFNGYGLIQNTNATDAGIPLTVKGSDGQSVSLQEWHSNGGTVLAAMSQNGKMSFDATITGGGTTGNQTINKPAGSVNFAAAATSLTVTNSLVSANSFVFAVVQTNDGTAYIKNVVPGAGSFVITLGAAATAETRVAFWVIN